MEERSGTIAAVQDDIAARITVTMELEKDGGGWRDGTGFFQINRENGGYSFYSTHGKGVNYKRDIEEKVVNGQLQGGRRRWSKERTLAWPLAVNTVTGRLRRFTSVSSVSAWEIRYQYGQSCIRLSLPDWRSNCAFFLYIFQIWELKAELTECDCRVRGETERTRGCSGPALLRGSWAVCLHSHICMHSIQLVRKDHPRLCRHPSWWDQPFPVDIGQYMYSV